MVFNRSCLRISRWPKGPPIREPAIRPKVAAAVQMVWAPVTPRCSRTGPKAPAVPCPPIIGMEPVHIPNSGESPMTCASPMESRFWDRIRAMMQNKIPPLFSTLKLAWKPTEVKKIIMQMVFNVSSKLNSSKWSPWRTQDRMENTSPPTTGAGIQKVSRAWMCIFRKTPRYKTPTARARVWYISRDKINFM